MYFVYSGYVSPDNCDCSYGPTYELEEFCTKEQVLEAYKEFNATHDNYPEHSYKIFRVIEGKELSFEPVSKVTEYLLR